MRVTVRVLPRSSKNEITWEENSLKVRLTAPPVDGAANTALIALLATRLNLPKRAFQIVHGTGGRLKILEIEGLTIEELAKKILG